MPGRRLHGVLLRPQEVAFLLAGDAQSHIGVRVAGRELETAVQKLDALIELAEVHYYPRFLK